MVMTIKTRSRPRDEQVVTCDRCDTEIDFEHDKQYFYLVGYRPMTSKAGLAQIDFCGPCSTIARDAIRAIKGPQGQIVKGVVVRPTPADPFKALEESSPRSADLPSFEETGSSRPPEPPSITTAIVPVAPTQGSVWDLSALNVQQKEIIDDALAKTSFRFESLIPGLQAQVRRTTIPVLFSDLSRYATMEGSKEAIIGHGHEGHSHTEGVGAHTIEREVDGRKQVLGLAWYSGKVEIEKTASRKLAQEVFLAEGAHMVDFFFMTPEQREKILDAYHPGELPEKQNLRDHGWFEETGNNDYWAWVGESFMYGFISAFTTVPGTGDAFEHRTTPQIGKAIREILQPTPKLARHTRSTIYHRMNSWHERQIKDTQQENFVSVEEAESRGLRRCKTCRWVGL